MERSKLNIFALTTAASTFLLLLAGSLVTSTGSGLAVPDWPLSFGKFFPAMVGGVLFEHGHRMMAGIVLILATILTVWLWKKEGRSTLSYLGTTALAVVLLQALLGGITVLFGLPPAVSILHAALAQTFFCFMVSIALFTSPIWERAGGREFSSGVARACALARRKNFRMQSEIFSTPPEENSLPPALLIVSVSTFILLYVQLILGASFRHGLGIRPLYWHTLNAFLIAFLGSGLSLQIIRKFKENRELFRAGVLFLFLLGAQMLLGLAAAAPLFGYDLALGGLRILVLTLHIGIGALLLADALVIALVSFHV